MNTREHSPDQADHRPRAVVFASAPLPGESFIKRFIRDGDLLVCADGGANRLVGTSLKPDYIIGDLDSVTVDTLGTLKGACVIHRPDQDSTDLHKALSFVESRGITEVLVFGATGARIDHTLGNLSLLILFKERLDIRFIDELCTIRIVNKELTITGKPGQIVSLWPLDRKAEGVCTTGLKYSLSNEPLLHDSRGISNELRAETATVTVVSGTLLAIIHHPDR